MLLFDSICTWLIAPEYIQRLLAPEYRKRPLAPEYVLWPLAPGNMFWLCPIKRRLNSTVGHVTYRQHIKIYSMFGAYNWDSFFLLVFLGHAFSSNSPTRRSVADILSPGNITQHIMPVELALFLGILLIIVPRVDFWQYTYMTFSTWNVH